MPEIWLGVLSLLAADLGAWDMKSFSLLRRTPQGGGDSKNSKFQAFWLCQICKHGACDVRTCYSKLLSLLAYTMCLFLSSRCLSVSICFELASIWCLFERIWCLFVFIRSLLACIWCLLAFVKGRLLSILSWLVIICGYVPKKHCYFTFGTLHYWEYIHGIRNLQP